MEKKKTQIFLDGPTEEEIENIRSEDVMGYTFNPTLYKNLGVKDYLRQSEKFAKISDGKSISLEVIADSVDEMVRQALLLSKLGKNVSVKVPIVFTNGKSTQPVIQRLVDSQVKLNITAIFTIEQIMKILPIIKDSNAIISVFAGRIFDIGLDANSIMEIICKYVHKNSNCKVLWASPRMSYDYFSANKIGCDIITMSVNLYKKLILVGKDPEQYSVDTVKMFFNDAKASGYQF